MRACVRVRTCACACDCVKCGGGRAVVEQTGDSLKVWFRVKARLGMYNCARTTSTRIWRDADEKHKEKDPEFRRQINLRMLTSACASVYAHECMGLLTRVRRCCHFEVVMPYSPETSGARPCGGDDNAYFNR